MPDLFCKDEKKVEKHEKKVGKNEMQVV